MSFIGAEPSSSMKSGRRIFTLPDMNIRRNCPVWNRTNSGRRDIRFIQVDPEDDMHGGWSVVRYPDDCLPVKQVAHVDPFRRGPHEQARDWEHRVA